MNEIVCAHHWSPWIKATLVEEEGVPLEFKICTWCNHTWKQGDAEPKVVTGRIE